jgi:signal transduction histidine kinase
VRVHGAHPSEVVRRRIVVGLLVVVITSLLQMLPALQRGTAIAVVAFRFAFNTFDLLAIVALASHLYRAAVRRKVSTSLTILGAVAVSELTATSVFAGVWALVHTYPGLRLAGEPRVTLAHFLVFGLVIGLLHCGVWALAFVFPYLAEDSRLSALEADKLRVEAEQLKSAAELARLRSQLEPHFLLNTLNAIAGLVTEDPREARRLLACLGDLLRDSLDDKDELQPLEDEIAWLRRYADILVSRHAGTLEFEWEIDREASRALVPRLLLQPLVENAVKHGALRRREGGRVVVRASFANNGEDGERRVVCVVEDNGPGVPDGAPRQGAFGLHSVRRRLALRFPDAKLLIESSEDGTRSVVDLPCGAPS